MPVAGEITNGIRTQREISEPVRPPPSLVLALMVGCAYCAGTKLGLLLTPPNTPISTLWPPNALLLAALLLTPMRTWPLLLGAVLPFHLAMQLASGIPALTAAGWYLTNVSEALLGAALLREISARRRMATLQLFESFEGILCFVLFGVVLAPVLTSFLDVGVVVGTGFGADYWRMWLDRSLSNMLATLTLVPPIVVVVCKWQSIKTSRQRYVEAALIAGAIALIVGAVFGAEGAHYSVVALVYLLLPVLLWAAVRFGSAGASIALLLIALFSTWNAIHDRGPFGPQAGDVRALQIFLSAIGVPLLCLAAALEERRTVEQNLRQHQQLASLVSQIAATFINIDWQKIDEQIDLSLARLREFLGADRVNLFEFTGEELRLRFAAFEGEQNRPPEKVSISHTGWVANDIYLGKGVLIHDVNELPADSVKRNTLAERGVKSIAIVPLGTKGSVAGTLSAVSTSEKKDWPPNLLPQLEILAELLYSAMQRKRAFEALSESEQRFRHTADHAPVLLWMCGTDALRTYFNRAWLEFTGTDLESQLGYGWSHLIHPEDVRACLNSYKAAFATRKEFKMEYRLRRPDGDYRWMLDIGVPRLDSQGRFLGYIGSALDVSERKSQEALAALTGKLITAQEEERRRIARELHDDVGQRIALMANDLYRLRNVPDSSLHKTMLRLLGEVNSIADCIRNVSHNLHPPGLDLLPLQIVLRSYVNEFMERTSVQVDFEADDVPPSVTQGIKLCLYRVVQESFQNIAKHSRANEAEVKLTGDVEGLTLVIKDHGKGFDLAQHSVAMGLGLTSMRERVAAIGGTITIKSAPAQGTQIEVYVPLQAAVFAA